ncbi:Signal transduction histidine kinase, contains PAS domain [Natrarchaeobaculum sulfurireducens]|uniref:Signal transduction histidine kinase, contains PAS domain n=2 Tax=Natrarchaeobaculum sulfurireducens TaxID=2044521 RepID=A0A346PGY1_9EURY|nr:Signal transduction histidine kinase, contains PAS domain [Natrarchaeobaculum sulfurireducens]
MAAGYKEVSCRVAVGMTGTPDGRTTEAPATGTTADSSGIESTDEHQPSSVGHAATIRRAGVTQLFDGTGLPTFILDSEGTVVEWNAAIVDLTGVDREEAVGHDHVSELFYPDGRRADTLADKVLEEPNRAHTAFGVELRDPERNRYGDTSTMIDRHGDEKHIDFSATPLYDGDELIGVIEVVVDRTETIEQRDATVDLVEEVGRTATEISRGDLTARAARSDAFDVLDGELVSVIDAVNEMADTLETLTGRVDDQATEIDAATAEANEAADEIAANVTEQRTLLDDSVDEMQSFAAGMEEVAAQANEVDSAATDAATAVEDGLEAGEDARDATEEIVAISDELVENVERLSEKMDEIEDVVEIVADVADETNLLALNANIEAARAGDSGDGFAVVADHVKTLADETRGHTDEITESLDELQVQSATTIETVDRSSDRIADADAEIEAVLDSLESIDGSVDEAAHGISEVARVIDDQAATVEELTSTMETVRSRAIESESAADRIVSATDRQDEIADLLVDRVEELQTVE